MSSKIVESVKRPDCAVAIEQTPGVWLVSGDAKETDAKAAAITAATMPHPAGGGRLMLRRVPAGVELIEVVAGKPIVEFATAATAAAPSGEVGRDAGRIG